MMLRQLYVVILCGFCGFLYGVLNIFLEVEDNSCRMTYMFGQPKFSRVKFKENYNFSEYGLYYYYEGEFARNVNTMDLKGAPVIFIPGNGGSYKQVRSLASVALRKSMSHEIRLDYFSIDYNEELSGLYGGYLQNQKLFLKLCIKAVLRLYKNPDSSTRKVVLIGHSMGGKIAHAILTDIDVAHLINTNIFISSPLDRPVFTLDADMESFYENTDMMLMRNSFPYVVDGETNVCSNDYQMDGDDIRADKNLILEHILLISIGGGNRDLLVRAGLTTSKFSDLHAMTSSIPAVWLSCDHLSSVWCLQLVLVINRFLFAIAYRDVNKYVQFSENDQKRLQLATHYFMKPTIPKITSPIVFSGKHSNEDTWYQDSKRVFHKYFRNGLKKYYNKIIDISKYETCEKLYTEIYGLENKEWIYGCNARRLPSGRFICETGTSLSHFIQQIPSKAYARSVAALDLNNIRTNNKNWTHILLRIPPTNTDVYINVDVHRINDRHIHVKTPRWFNFKTLNLLNETLHGTFYYRMLIEGLDQPHQSVEVNIEPIACSRKTYSATIKICVPWAAGFNSYNVLTESTKKNVYIHVPFATPHNYNTSKNPVVVEFFLDPVCRFSISYKYSIKLSMSRIIHEFITYLPAHFAAVLFAVLKTHIFQFDSQSTSMSVKPYIGFFQYVSLSIVIGCRVFKKILDPLSFLPTPENSSNSIFVAIVIHSAAIVFSIVISLLTWIALIFYGNIIPKFTLRIIRIPLLVSPVLLSLMEHLPITFGILCISLAFQFCSGIALIIASTFYFVKISNAYKDYLECWTCNNVLNFLRNQIKGKSKQTVLNTDNMNLTVDRNDELHTSDNGILYRLQKDLYQSDGLQNISFHVVLFLMLQMLVSLNAVVTLAWMKNKESMPHLSSDPNLVPTVIVLFCLACLLQLEAPNKVFSFRYGYKAVSVILTGCAFISILYCQDKVFRLNYIIAFAYVLILVQELLCKLLSFFTSEK